MKKSIFALAMLCSVIAISFGNYAMNKENLFSAILFYIAGAIAFACAVWLEVTDDNYLVSSGIEDVNSARDSRSIGKWVVIVRAARSGEFGGFVSMKAVRGGDEWRVVEADCAANAVCNVLGAGEVPVMWKKWEELSVLRRLQLTVRDFVRGFF